MNDDQHEQNESLGVQRIRQRLESELTQELYSLHHLNACLLKIETMKAQAEYIGAVRASLPPISEGQRDLAISTAIAKIVHLGGLLNKTEELIGHNQSTFQLMHTDSHPEFDGSFEEFREWVEQNYWGQSDNPQPSK